uniref:MATH domain-containing protein n=1 Tax=Macrostomum lignano TaxID=282301 RepID=A0A1I8GU95_9PLAT
MASKAAAAKPAAAAAKQAADSEEVDAEFVKVMTDDQRQLLELVTAELRQEATCDSLLDSLADKILQAERRLASLELRCPTALLWRVDDLGARVRAARAGQAAAFEGSGQPLSRLGYRLAISLCLNGEGRSRGKFISLFVSVCRSEFDRLLSWPFRHRLYLSIVDQGRVGRDLTRLLIPYVCRENDAFLGRPVADRNAKFGIEDFAPIEQVLSGGSRGEQFVKDDALYVRLEVPLEDFDTS